MHHKVVHVVQKVLHVLRFMNSPFTRALSAFRDKLGME